MSIRGVQQAYKKFSNTTESIAPETISAIAEGKVAGNKTAAIQAFEEVGQVIGESLANAITLLDAGVVIGGGISGASHFLIPAIITHLESKLYDIQGNSYQRVVPKIYNTTTPQGLEEFVRVEAKTIAVPFSDQKVEYNETKKLPIGVSTLGTNKAVALGAYAMALTHLDVLALKE